MPRLRSVPSIGPVTAAAFLAAIDDAQRFHHAHQLEADLGLMPGEHSSGETPRRGAITKAGHSRTRWLPIQAAVSILRRRPPSQVRCPLIACINTSCTFIVRSTTAGAKGMRASSVHHAPRPTACWSGQFTCDEPRTNHVLPTDHPMLA